MSIKQDIRDSIKEWGCVGKFGYGQGRAVAEFGEEEVGDGVCYKLCPRSDECRDQHFDAMDKRYPEIAEIVKKTVTGAVKTGLPVMQTVISAMNVAVNRQVPQALRIRQGLKKYQVTGMTDHYVYGQLENLDNGISKRAPDTDPVFQLVESGSLD